MPKEKDNVRTPGTRIKVLARSVLHEGQKGEVIKDYGNTVLIKAENEKHRHSYKSRVGLNNEDKDPKSFLPGKYFMVDPKSVIEIAKDK